jgi:thiamine biosynthesis lipoprotein
VKGVPEAAALELGEARLVHRFSHEAMATVFEVRSAHPDAAYAGQAAHAAFTLLDRLEQELSRFLPNSDVSRINELRSGEAARVGPDTMECLVIARHMFELTGGAFDVSIGSGLDRLELDPGALAVHARADGVRLDLGGIGKGFALDRMVELLEEWGLERSLVHGGWSSVLALEPPPDQDGWPLRLRVPAASSTGPLATLEARQRALSASGTQKGDHIRDPRTGKGVPLGAVWVTIPRERDRGLSAAAVAECLSTAFMVLAWERVEELCRQNPGLQVWRVESETGQNTQALHLGTAATAQAGRDTI